MKERIVNRIPRPYTLPMPCVPKVRFRERTPELSRYALRPTGAIHTRDGRRGTGDERRETRDERRETRDGRRETGDHVGTGERRGRKSSAPAMGGLLPSGGGSMCHGLPPNSRTANFFPLAGDAEKILRKWAYGPSLILSRAHKAVKTHARRGRALPPLFILRRETRDERSTSE